jgi:deoxyribonuclease-4
MKKYIGAHVSSSGGVANAPINATKIAAKAFALFTRNQRQWNSKPLTDRDIDEFQSNLINSGITKDYILPHDSYLINLGSPDNDTRNKSIDAFVDEVNRCDILNLKYLNFHPGNAKKNITPKESIKISEDECIELIANSINYTLDNTKNIILVIENTAGQGSDVGYKFEHLRDIISKVKDKSRIGVCLDTCHTFVSGYNIRDNYDSVFSDFDNIVGFEYLKAMHINDSKIECGKRVDRHQSIGMGHIGIDFFKKLMNDCRFDNIPLILETIDETIWAEEIKMLYSFDKRI